MPGRHTGDFLIDGDKVAGLWSSRVSEAPVSMKIITSLPPSALCHKLLKSDFFFGILSEFILLPLLL